MRLSKQQENFVFRIAQQIGRQYSRSGGDFHIHELYDKAVTDNNLNDDEAKLLDAMLIKQISGYYGRALV